MARLAVVLFNLGGPDSPEAVRPFLFNLFNDPAIIGAPGFIRWPLAQFISRKRAPIARGIYANIGGRSPLLEQTERQARALEQALAIKGHDASCVVAMRYWKPFAREAAAKVRALQPDHIVALPLYPQYSTTTSGSSLKQWMAVAMTAGLTADAHSVCCFPTEPGFIGALAELTRAGYEEARTIGTPRVLFTAHGLPKVVVERGDPYQAQVEATVAATVEALGIPGLDYVTCYQSRVGPMEWIGPSTDDEVKRAGAEKRPLVVVPVAFVSEHSETLVELDIEYFDLAKDHGVPIYVRVPTVRDHGSFIAGLADLVDQALLVSGRPCSHVDGRICGADRVKCPHPGPVAR